jgi:hypothetical protein
MSLSEKALRKKFLPTGVWAANAGDPILLTFEPSGEGDGTEIAWAELGERRKLGRYNFCPHLQTLLTGINQALVVNDGIGMGGETLLHDANQAIKETRYRLGNCAVEPLIAVAEGIVTAHYNAGHRDTLWTPGIGINRPPRPSNH